MADAAIESKQMPLLDHLIELRGRLIKASAAFIGLFFVCFYFAEPIYGFLVQPLADSLGPSGNKDDFIF